MITPAQQTSTPRWVIAGRCVFSLFCVFVLAVAIPNLGSVTLPNDRIGYGWRDALSVASMVIPLIVIFIGAIYSRAVEYLGWGSVVLSLGWFMWITFGSEPVFFADRQVSSNDVVTASSATEAAFSYVPWIGSDARIRQRLRVVVSERSDATVVMMIDPQCEDDSTSVLCVRLTIIKPDTRWRIVRQQQAWQGRGRIGWTTLPTS